MELEQFKKEKRETQTLSKTVIEQLVDRMQKKGKCFKEYPKVNQN